MSTETDKNTVNSVIADAVADAVASLNAEAGAQQLRFQGTIASDPPPRTERATKQRPQLESRTSRMGFDSALPPSVPLMASAESLSPSGGPESSLPDPPTPGTYVLGSIDGVIQWIATEECQPTS